MLSAVLSAPVAKRTGGENVSAATVAVQSDPTGATAESVLQIEKDFEGSVLRRTVPTVHSKRSIGQIRRAKRLPTTEIQRLVFEQHELLSSGQQPVDSAAAHGQSHVARGHTTTGRRPARRRCVARFRPGQELRAVVELSKQPPVH